VAVQTHDDGFHEIQLNGKQLVFLFMAVTVVSVVIFLLGVMIGRGVRAERAASEQSIAAVADAPSPQPAAPPAAAPAGTDPRQAAAPAPAGDLTYFDRLEKPSAPPEQLKAPATKSDARAERATAPAPAPAAKPAAAPKPSSAPPPPSDTAGKASEPRSQTSSGSSDKSYAVQVAALNVRAEADAIAKRLSSKGYAAYVMAPVAGTPQVYRVRIGKFSTRREADAMAAKLQKEEQFKPWVTR
jgi:DedD protein